MNLTREQLDSIEQSVRDGMRRLQEEQAEYKRDLDAIDRLKTRYLPQNGNGHGPKPSEPVVPVWPTVATQPAPPAPVVRRTPDQMTLPPFQTVIAMQEHIMKADPTKEWTAPEMYRRLLDAGASFNGDNAVKSVALNMSRLMDRGKLALVRRGAGKIPHVYKWNGE
jgi:hypothetical protein